MAKNQNTTNNQNTQNLFSQLNNLLGEAKKVNQEIDATAKESREKISDLEMKINDSINKVEQIYFDLDQIEKEAGDEIDKLILEQAEVLAEE